MWSTYTFSMLEWSGGILPLKNSDHKIELDAIFNQIIIKLKDEWLRAGRNSK